MSVRAERTLLFAMALLALAPLSLVALEGLAAWVAPAFAAELHRWLAPLCHQIPARCPTVHDHALGACWRCLGVDVGMAASALALAIDRGLPTRHAPLLLGLGALDWCLAQCGVGPDVAIERLVFGALFGAGVALAWLALARVTARAVAHLSRRRPHAL